MCIVCDTGDSFSMMFSVLARELISRLLQIKMRKRFTADKSLAHDWLQVLVLVNLFFRPNYNLLVLMCNRS